MKKLFILSALALVVSSQASYAGGYRMQKGYMKSNGTYVAPHLKTNSDAYKWNNLNPESDY